ncbi:anti-sigma-28 factor, FlgM family [Desulfotomaculum arcticum]|uniref:Negative regulator of flagellin synthesis n=1 Tax=Desulfotruncus arcticus DSM 17038 TaxID=1121424 RepID=A0A1I2MV31_9FIRM|nr:flagellar biosynthesis anti-sigma factor FlgM [Desulfotruncus arcticus]SFF95322.1 anti-sigma-28 factor, FlgM family [Desulfotomaculum arcticum] [Desulfotruncus arcticus DSM 17038]
MKINPTERNIIDAYKAQSQNNNAAAKKQINPRHDRTEISTKAQEIINLRAQLKAMPDIRQDRVDEIKAQIADGTYQPCAEKIAGGLIRERNDQN